MIDLTVVTVCRNAGNKLKPTIDSVLAQKAKGSISIEHIVIDGASQDGSLNYLEQEKAKGNIEVLVSEPDKGIYHAMNKGLWMARGKVISFLNAGDSYMDVDLARYINPITQHDKSHLATSASLVEGNGIVVGSKVPWMKYAYLVTPWCHQAYFAETEKLRQLGGFDMRYKCFADTDLFYKMTTAHGTPEIVHENVVLYSLDGVSKNALNDYFTEQILLKWEHFEEIESRMQLSREYAKATCYALILDAYKMWTQYCCFMWREMEMLCIMIRTARSYTKGLRLKATLAFIDKVMLPALPTADVLPELMPFNLLKACKKLVNVSNPPFAPKCNETADEMFRI